MLALDWLDYVLLKADSIGLARHGLSALSRDDVVAALCKIGSTSSKSVSIYDWPARVEVFLRSKAESLTTADLTAVVDAHPFVAENVPEECDRLTQMTADEVIRARAWFWSQGWYRRGQSSREYVWIVPASRIASEIFANVLHKEHRHSMPRELGLQARDSTLREYPSVPVNDRSDLRMSRNRLAEYRQSISNLHLLGAVGLRVPTVALRAINDKTIEMSLNLKESGRYKTLPAPVVFGALRHAVEFSLEYGNDLITSTLNMARAARAANMDIISYATSGAIKASLTPKLLALGVSQWAAGLSGEGPGATQENLARSEYYRRLRGNVGFWELLRVLYGSVQIVLGTLMARRVRELWELTAGKCLDTTGTYLIFDLGKSGVGEERETVAKPIPPIGARLVRELERLQDGLIELGLIDERTNLFACPYGNGTGTLVSMESHVFSRSNDYFCDYFELPLDGEGRRYYIRQHQLRRFFAMLFFWSNSFGGLDTLRDFLGHTNLEDVYRYITESTPGTLLRSVQAEWASEAVQRQWDAAGDLAELVSEHFQTRNFRLLSDEELTEYIEDLLEEGVVSVEPEFLDGGKKYRILIKVSMRETAR